MNEDEVHVSHVPEESGTESHRHAHSRLGIALAAVAFVLLAGFVWVQWGEEIKEACTGSEGACTVELPDEQTTQSPTSDQATTSPGSETP